MSIDSSISNSIRSIKNRNLLNPLRHLRTGNSAIDSKNRVRNTFAVLFAAVLLLSFSQVKAQEIMPSFATLPTGWATDRYEPASFSNIGTYQGRSNVLGIGIDTTTRAAARGAQSSTFYNTQGRKYSFPPLAYGLGSRSSALLYIPASWANESSGAVRSDLWATMVNASDVISAYPIIGFTNYNGGGRYRVWDTSSGTWVDLAQAVNYDAWTKFTIELNADSSLRYYIDDAMVYTIATPGSSAAFRDVMLQAYNFEDPALSPAAQSTSPYTAHWSNLPPTVVTVNTASLNGWVFASENTAGGSGSFVHGPGTPPNGVGSARLQIPSNDNGYILAREGFTGTRLDQLTSLSYSTYRTVGGAALAPSFFFSVDNDLTDADTSWKGRLTYEPYHTETINSGVWHTWTPFTATGNWWFSNATLATTSGCTMGNPCSLAEVLAVFPNAGFRNALGSPMGFKVGSGWAGGFDGNVDSLLIGINSQETLFDFEADPITHVVDDNLTECPSAGFTNISAAIAAAFSGDIIQVCPGTYNESPQINKSLTLQSTGGRDVTTIQLSPAGTPGTLYGGIGIDNAAADVTIDGFTIRGNDAVGAGLATSNVLVRTANSVTLTNSRIRIGATGSGANGDDGIGIVNYYGLPTNSITVTNTEFSPLTTQGYRAFYANPGVENFVFQNNQVTGHFIRRHISEARTSNVSNNVVTGAGPGTGSPAGGLGVDNYLNYYPDQTATFTGNTVSNVSAGLWIGYYSAVSNVTATGNSFINNQYGVSVFAGSGNVTLNHNRIAGNSIAGIRNDSASFNAENNWWGCNYGPAVAGVGCPVTPNGVVGAVDSSPWLTLTTAASPNLVIMPTTSTVTSKLVWNSDGVDTSGMGTVLNTTPVSFAGTNGSVSPTNTTLTSGVATTTFTPTTPGGGNVATTVDGQTTDAPITVLATCSTVSVPTGITTPTGAQVVVPVNTTDVSTRGVLSTDMTITFDPAVITPSAGAPFYGVSVGAVGASGGSPNLTVNSPAPGTLVISVYDSNPWSGSGAVVNLSFTAVGLPATSTPVTLSGVRYNFDTPCVTTSNGDVTVISGTISGVVSYANAKLPGPGFRPVPNATLSATGSINQSTSSAFVTGEYSLSGMGAGAYTVTPSKSGDVNGILSNDAALIAQHVVGLTTLDAAQLKAAKVSGNAILTSYDAALISRYIVMLPGSGLTGSWVFDPINRSYTDVNTNQANQDYAGTLMGDVDGNWVAPVAFGGLYEPANRIGQKPISVELPGVRTETESEFNVPVVVGDVTDRGILGYQFDVQYDPAVIEPIGAGIDRTETMSGEYSLATNIVEPGLMKVVLYGVEPLTSEGTLTNLRFRAIGAEGSASAVRILNFIWHDGSIPAEVKDGSVEIRAEASGNSIGGMVLSSTGDLVAGARITITDTNGETRSAISNAFGNYRFDGLSVGQTYTVSVQSKRYSFTPVTVSVTNEPLSRLDLIANQ